MKNWIFLIFAIAPLTFAIAQSQCHLKGKDGSDIIAMTKQNDEFSMSNGFLFHHNGKTQKASPQTYSHVRIGEKTYQSVVLPQQNSVFLKVEVQGDIEVFSHNYIVSKDVFIEKASPHQNTTTEKKITDPAMMDEDIMIDEATNNDGMDMMIEDEPIVEYYIKMSGKLVKINEKTFKEDLKMYFPGLTIEVDKRYYDVPDIVRNYRSK